jgi:branched-chain amino acid aminotransferase
VSDVSDESDESGLGGGADASGGAGRPVAWLDGRIVDARAAAIRVDDHGLTVGDGVFETLLVRDGRPGFWDRHMARLARSMQAMAMAPIAEDVLASAVAEVVAACGAPDARLRITVTGGPGPGGLRRGPRPTLLVTAAPLVVPAGVAAPVSVLTVPFARNDRGPLVGVKSTSYAEAAVIQARIDAAGADDALLGDTRGRLSEALTANVFLVVGGRRVTPSTDSGCLGGIVREVLLEAGLAEEADVALDQLGEATEVFLTSSVAGVRPVAAIDGRPVPVVGGAFSDDALAAFRSAEAVDAANG